MVGRHVYAAHEPLCSGLTELVGVRSSTVDNDDIACGRVRHAASSLLAGEKESDSPLHEALARLPLATLEEAAANGSGYETALREMWKQQQGQHLHLQYAVVPTKLVEECKAIADPQDRLDQINGFCLDGQTLEMGLGYRWLLSCQPVDPEEGAGAIKGVYAPRVGGGYSALSHAGTREVHDTAGRAIEKADDLVQRTRSSGLFGNITGALEDERTAYAAGSCFKVREPDMFPFPFSETEIRAYRPLPGE
ncbi:MAG: hypothetical protein ED559_06140 [Phycisphaera sp.]|nr:MAG: hypothetical protein ED559_06140 [Phycisphaera sp.]